jgi:hypothetical protein
METGTLSPERIKAAEKDIGDTGEGASSNESENTAGILSPETSSPETSGLATAGPGITGLNAVFTGPGAGGTAADGLFGEETPVRDGQPGGPAPSKPENIRNQASCILPAGNSIGDKRKSRARIRPRCEDAQGV